MLRLTSVSRAAAVVATIVALAPALAGAQTPLMSPSPSDPRVEAAQGKKVRLTGTDGAKRTGTLRSVTTTGLVLHENGQDVTVPLASVRKVEKVGHGIRNGIIVGAIAGFIYGYGVFEEDLSGSSREVMGGALLAGLGAAGGAGIGALFNRARRDGYLVYERRGTTASVSPILFPGGRAGFALAVRW